MTFLTRHSLTAPATDRVSAITELLNGRVTIEAGMYDGGLIAVVDRSSATKLLQNWPQFSDGFPVLLTTAFGEVFVFDRRREQVLFINTQYGTTTEIDPEIAWVLDDFLENPGVKADLLQVDKVKRLQRQCRDLKYHEVFVLEPWIMFGGEDVDENYSVGDCAVYLDLVGQTLT
jgi:hypothetical protein